MPRSTQELLDAANDEIYRILTGAQEWADADISQKRARLEELRQFRKELQQELTAASGGTAGFYTPACGG